MNYILSALKAAIREIKSIQCDMWLLKKGVQYLEDCISDGFQPSRSEAVYMFAQQQANNLFTLRVTIYSNLDYNECTARTHTRTHTHPLCAIVSLFLPRHYVSSMDKPALEEAAVAPAVGSSETLISANEDLQEVLVHVRGSTPGLCAC